MFQELEHIANPLALNTRWFSPTVSAHGFADKLNVSVGSVRQYAAKDTRFPAPSASGAGLPNLWTLAQVYDYCIHTGRRRARGGIPRLYPVLAQPMTSEKLLAPATFEAAEALPVLYRDLALTGVHPLARVPIVQYWKPGDGRGSVAVLYLAGGGSVDCWEARDLAVSAARFMHARDLASAAIVITDESWRPVPNSASDVQRTIVAAEVGDPVWLPANAFAVPTEPGRSWRPSRVDLDADPPTSVYDLGWFDLLYLLQTDLPYWPAESRTVNAIANWTQQGHNGSAKTYSPG